MSNEPRHLRDWIVGLYTTLEEAEPHGAAAIRKLAGARMSRMELDADRVTLRFVAGRLQVRRMRAGTGKLKSPYGATDRTTVTALLLGYMEISEAIAQDQIRLRGTADEVMAICAIIEVLVDASTRVPGLQRLAAAFLQMTGQETVRANRRTRAAAARAQAEKERALLQRESLLRAPGATETDPG